jgi:hypothetical protein
LQEHAISCQCKMDHELNLHVQFSHGKWLNLGQMD